MQLRVHEFEFFGAQLPKQNGKLLQLEEMHINDFERVASETVPLFDHWQKDCDRTRIPGYTHFRPTCRRRLTLC